MSYRVNRKSIFAVEGWRTVGWFAVIAIAVVAQGWCVGLTVGAVTLFIFGKLKYEWELIETGSENTLDTFEDATLANDLCRALCDDLRQGEAPVPGEVGYGCYYQKRKRKVRQSLEARKVIDQWNQSSLSNDGFLRNPDQPL